MGLIPISQGRKLFTQAFVGAWKETLPPKDFFRSFFMDKTVATKFVSIEVQRGTRKIAVDVLRGSTANRNKKTLSTEKVIVPPYFFEGFNNNDLALYDQLFATDGEQTSTDAVLAATQEVRDMYDECRYKIERAYEKQAAEVLQTGKVTTKTLDTIDFKPKTSHIFTASPLWTAATPEIEETLIAVCNTLRKDGAAAGEFDLILGQDAATLLLNSTWYKEKFGTSPVMPSQYILPKLNETSGAVFHNRISAGSYVLNLWSNNESYTDENGTDTPFMDPKKVVIIAKSFKGVMSFAAVPRILTAAPGQTGNPGLAQVIDRGKFVLNNYVDYSTAVHNFDIKSAGVPVPVTIDHFACIKVKA